MASSAVQAMARARRGRRLRIFGMAAVLLVATTAVTGCQPQRTITYRIATRGPVTADVGEFARHAAATLTDTRGWSLGGAIRFAQVEGAADFTLWLATAGSLPSFGPPCHPQWSCRSGRNVIINEARWQGATPTWPWGLDQYRHYVVNHEVGHFLGLGHASCTGAGHRAPVMVQQSKGGAPMGSCRFNTWPTEAERQSIARRWGVAAYPTWVPDVDNPTGSLDGATVTQRGVVLEGWAVDADEPSSKVLVAVDGNRAGVFPADVERPDVFRLFPAVGPNRGFRVTVPVPPGRHDVCVAAVGAGPGAWVGMLGCRTVVV